MRDNITEIMEELESWGVPKPLVPLYVTSLIQIGHAGAIYRRETAEAVAKHSVEAGTIGHWPSGRIKQHG